MYGMFVSCILCLLMLVLYKHVFVYCHQVGMLFASILAEYLVSRLVSESRKSFASSNIITIRLVNCSELLLYTILTN